LGRRLSPLQAAHAPLVPSPRASTRADLTEPYYLRALSGRDDDVMLELISGDATALAPIRQARVAF
jgi:hypothetical protein